MKRAHQHREYHNVHAFQPPDGIVAVEIDAETGQLATTACPKIRTQMFIAGSQPVEVCHLHGGGRMQVAGWDPTIRPAEGEVPDTRRSAVGGAPRGAEGTPGKSERSIRVTPAQADKPAEEKKGFFGRLKSIFK
jgi:penicillin-binding protein 1B